jgi:hypothetical protein
MKVRLLAAAIVVSAISAALAVGYEIHYGGKMVKVKEEAGVFDSEYSAAYYKSLNRKPVPAIASIAGGERVAVLWDTHGKDYWACYVRTSEGELGWVICTSLAMDA